jgi:hypothetical protein
MLVFVIGQIKIVFLRMGVKLDKQTLE